MKSDHESRGHHARADDSEETEFGQSVARSATSLGLNAAARALGEPPPIAPPIVPPIATTSASATSSATVSAAPKRKRYGGKQGWKSGGDFGDCKACDHDAFYND